MEFVAPPLISTAVDAHIVDICMVDSFVPFVDRLSQSTRLCGSAWSAPAERAMMDSNVCNRDADIQVVRCFVALTWLAGATSLPLLDGPYRLIIKKTPPRLCQACLDGCLGPPVMQLAG